MTSWTDAMLLPAFAVSTAAGAYIGFKKAALVGGVLGGTAGLFLLPAALAVYWLSAPPNATQKGGFFR